jgi:transcription antitermination protein NusB
MINRRFLRTATMQQIFSLQLEWNASLDLALQVFEDELREYAFSINQNNDWTQARLDEAASAFELLRQQPIEDRRATFFPPELRPIAEKALADSAISAQHDLIRRRSLLESNLDQIYFFFLHVLLIPAELAHQVLIEEEEKQNRHIKPDLATEAQLRLANNPYVSRLANSEDLLARAGRLGISWIPEHALLRSLYRDALKANPQYEHYLAASPQNPQELEAEHLRFFRWLLRSFLLSATNLQDYFEERNFAYGELRPGILQLLQHSLKQWQEINYEGQIPLPDQGEEWREDIAFATLLFDSTLSQRKYLLNLLAEQVNNWDISRIATTDLTLILMALTEITHTKLPFSGIPVKTTINEYLEIAKQYSTPQSFAFINGILDAMVTTLTEKKMIRKTARGLMDNK